ncbi:hypothetical protein ABZ357_07345 [Streptomyces sp. NPDC005917]|uniref:hypothetical protein n=1 Tax=unclassified Streptomyces TaxID=2593676 RepID=UPI0033EF0D04
MAQDEKTADVVKPLDNHASAVEENLLDTAEAPVATPATPSEDDGITTLDNHASSEKAAAVLLDNHASDETA